MDGRCGFTRCTRPSESASWRFPQTGNDHFDGTLYKWSAYRVTSVCRFLGDSLQPVLRLSYPLSKPFRVKQLPVRLPKEQPVMAPTPLEEIDKAVQSLRDKADDWQRVSCAGRSALLQACIDTLPSVARDAAAAAADAHGSYGSGIGEEQ